LLAAGAEVDAREEGGTTALIRASAKAIRPDLDVIRALLEAGADVDARDNTGRTSLFYAATSYTVTGSRVGHRGDVEAVRVLLEAGADPGARDNNRETALQVAFRERWPAIVDILRRAQGVEVPGVNASRRAELPRRRVSSPRRREQTPEQALLNAASWGDVATVRDLVSKGADVDGAPENRGLTPLAAASRAHRLESMAALLDLGADPGSLLVSVAGAGYTDGTRLLLDHGVDVNLRDESGRTALIVAAEGGHAEVVRLLIARSADVDATDPLGMTALSWGAFRGHVEVVRELTEAGADTTIRDQDGNTALELARRMDHSEVIGILEGQEKDW